MATTVKSLNNTVPAAKISALSSDDTITNSGDYVTIDGGAGNDFITNTGKNASVGGDNGSYYNRGNDTIVNSGANVSISGGNDSINNTGDSVTIGGSGNSIVSSGKNVSISASTSKVTVSGANTTIRAGNGGHNISLESGATNAVIVYDSAFSYTGTDYNNNVIYGFGATSSIKIGDGKDTFSKQTSGADVVIKIGTKNVTLKGAADLSTVNVAGREVVSHNINNTVNNTLVSGDALNDTITNSGDSVTIKAFDGNDKITNSGTKVSIDAGAGNDTISLTGGGSNVILSSAGSNVVYGFKATDTIKVGDGTAKFWTLPSGNDAIVAFNGGNFTLKNAASLSDLNIAGTESFSIKNTLNAKLIQGGVGDDTVNNRGDKVSISGGNGNDYLENRGNNGSISGGAGNDSIFNDGSNVLIDGGDGSDTIDNGGSNVSINGGEGSDSIRVYDGSNLTINGGAGNDSIDNRGDKVLISGGDGSDSIRNGYSNYNDGGGNNVTIDAGTGNDSIQNYGSNVSISGGDGSDFIDNNSDMNYYNGAPVTIDGGDGDDFIRNQGGTNGSILGGAGDDEITSRNYHGNSNMTIDGGEGNDRINNQDGSNVTIDGGDGNDYIWKDHGSNVSVNGGDGSDSIRIYDGSNLTIDGGAGNDSIENELGSDMTIDGGEGSDTIENMNGANVTINGGADNDSIRNEASDVTVSGGANDDTIDSYGGAVSIDGGAGNDDILNAGDSVTAHSGEGDDIIYNGSYSSNNQNGSYSKLYGDGGNDSITNSGDYATLDGGDGNDTISNGYDIYNHGYAYVNNNSVSVDGGAGDDLIRNMGSNVTINGGEGSDTIDNANFDSSNYSYNYTLPSVMNVKISGGVGDDSIRNGATSGVTIDTGEGNDTIKVGNTSVTSFAVENFGAGDVIELYRAVNSIDVVNGALVAGNLTISGGKFSAGEQGVWEVNGTAATFSSSSNGLKAKLGSDGKTITFEASTGGTSKELFDINGLKAGITAEDLAANVTVNGTQITVNEKILGEDDLSISEGYTLALADSVPKSEDISANWQINSTTATYTGDGRTAGYVLENNTITYREAVDGETFTLTGVKKNLTKSVLRNNVTIDGATVTLNENVLGDSNVSISDDYILALASTVPQSESTTANWDISSAGDTSTAIYSAGSATAGYSLDDNKILYNGATGGTFTLTGLSKNFISGDVSIDGTKIILSAKALGKTNVTLTTDDGFTLALGDDCPTVGTVEKSWTLSGTTATLRDAGKSDGYKLTNSKTVAYTAAVGGKTLLTVKGVADGTEVTDVAIDGLSVSGKVLTVKPSVVGENFSVGSGYKVVFSEGNYSGSKFTGTTGKDTLEVDGTGLIVDGNKGNDTITSNGEGGNTYLFAANGGKDVVKGYGDDDKIKITDGSNVTASVKGSNVIVKAGTATMTLKNAATGRQITVVDAEDETLIDKIFYADRVVVDDGTTLTAAFNSTSFAATDEFPKVDGSAVLRKFSLTGGDEDNTLIGGTGMNFINGGGGTNELTGGRGNDTFAVGGGNDTITDYGVGTDKISLTADITDFEIDGSDVIVSFGDNKSVTISDGVGKKINFIKNGKTTTELFESGGKTNTAKTSITLASATTNYTASSAMLTIDGGLTDGVQIVGNAKPNKIFGSDVNDLLQGGAKNDTLTGGDGSDIFVFESGKDVITDYDSDADTISLAAAPTSETLNAKGDVILKFGTDSLTIKKVGDTDGRTIVFAGDDGDTTKTYFKERIVGSDGVTLQSTYRTATFALDELPKVDGSATTAKIALTGNDSDNVLIGGRGANLIDGGSGDDILIGKGGADTFVYSGGDDTISDYGNGSDRISLTSAIKNYDLSGDNVIISFDDGSLTIADAANSSVTFVETVNGKVTTNVNAFASEGIFNKNSTAVTLNAATESYTAPTTMFTVDGGLASGEIEIVGNTKKNQLFAGNFGSTLSGGKGNDKLWGGSGADTFIYGGGQDVIYGFGDGDELKLSGKFTASVVGDNILFKVGSTANAIKLTDYTAKEFLVNGDPYKISGGEFIKK